MENTQIMVQEKLGFFKILKEALIIPFKNPHFIIYTLLTSIPLFCFLLVYETLIQHTLIQTAKILSQAPPESDLYCKFCLDWNWTTLGFAERLIDDLSPTYLLVLLYLGILHFLDLITLIAIVDSASTIHTGKKTLNLIQLLQNFIKETRFKGPLITSICTLLLGFLILSGLFCLAAYMYIASRDVLFMLLFGVLFIALLAKYIEWSAIWNMGIVISILEEKKQGDVALLISSYLSRGSRRRGFLFVLVFLVWRLGLRLSSLYLGWTIVGENFNKMAITAPLVGLVCVGNVTKWLVFVVYFYDCKRRREEKKNIDLEESNAAAAGIGGTE
ncbi:unnamed protein product [Camellia sinensis]|nr:uncharacterized protein LOC114280921 [Camellia sinensis]